MTDTSDPRSPLSSASTEAALLERIALQERRVLEALAPYDATTATLAWLDNLRAIEDCINLQTVEWDDEAFKRQLFEMPVAGLIHDPSPLMRVHHSLAVRFSEQFANRFRQLLLQCVSMVTSFKLHGAADVIGDVPTLAALIGYLQSRRRHFVALLHVLPHACQGSIQVAPYEALTVMLHIVELTGIPLYSAQVALMVKLAREKLGLPCRGGVEIPLLDAGFLEPERSRIDEMCWPDVGRAYFHAMQEELKPDRLASAAELRNDIAAIEAAYAEFDLADSDFAIAAGLIRRISRQCVVRDFWVEVASDEFTAMLDAAGADVLLGQALVHPVSSYLEGLSSYAPFVQVDGLLRSTVTLLSRFAYNWRARTLDSRKRYQIRTGFIFENVVKDKLSAQGFVIQHIKRINRREFDVVTVRDGVIWNVQCKNNFLDLSTVDSDAHRFAGYNRALVTSYEKALDKDRRREHLLQAKLSLDEIQHVVVARFPVVCDNPRIVPFSRIDEFSAVAAALLADHGPRG